MKAILRNKFVWAISLPIIYIMIISGFKEKEFMINAISVTELSETKNFINLIFTDTYFGSWFHQTPDNERSLEKNIGNIKDSLHFNSVHIYGYGNRGGGIDDSLSLYKDYIDSLMNKVDSAGLRGFYGRNKIEQLSYGQRLIYEVASTNRSRVNSGFSYDTIMADTYQTDSSRTFLHATPIPSSGNNSPGWLCKNIYENLQHGDLINFTQWDTMKWFVKPVMRIKQNDFNDSSNVPVVAVVTVNFKGKKLDSVIIKVKNFADDNGNYQGNYINYYNFEDPEYPLKISGSRELTDGLSNGMIDSLWYQWKDSCKVDFKVYWFGEVEVWFDKMIVDDEWGNNLFHPVLQDRLRFESKIIEEVREFTDHMEQGSFFIDELSHSQIPCVKRVYEIMKQTNPDCKLNFAVTNFLNIRSYKDNSIGNRELLKEISAESFNADAHEVSIVYLPQSIPLSDRDPHFESWRFTNNSNYNRYLQERVFGDKSELTGINPIEGEDITNWNDYRPTNFGTLVYQTELARNQRDQYSPLTKFIIQPQIQGVLKVNGNGYYEGVREPFNEEIEAQAMIGIAHGADGICWFIYHSTPTNFYQSRSTEYAILGLQNNDPPDYSHRHRNIYGQDKWKAVREMNIKIEHWKPTMDKINWTSGWSVHKDGAVHEFISDIKSIYYDAIPPYDFSPGNDDPVKYWEMGFFDPDFNNPEVNSNDRSKYFIMVNRRCVPNVSNDGDLRQLKIKFDSTQLSGFRNWKIIELDLNNVIRTFDKDSNIYVDMKIFQPGEGKLYKLAPVMQEGGTLVANEQVESITFVCNGPVNNNGKDISILEGTKINFKTGAGINMTGGKLTCSNYSTNTSENVLLKGYNGDTWNGIVMNNCMRSVIQRTRFEDAKNCIVISNGTGGSKYTAKVIRRNYFKVTADSGKALTINNQMEMAIDSNTILSRYLHFNYNHF